MFLEAKEANGAVFIPSSSAAFIKVGSISASKTILSRLAFLIVSTVFSIVFSVLPNLSILLLNESDFFARADDVTLGALIPGIISSYPSDRDWETNHSHLKVK